MESKRCEQVLSQGLKSVRFENDSYTANPEHQISYIRDAWTFFNVYVCVCVVGGRGEEVEPSKGQPCSGSGWM